MRHLGMRRPADILIARRNSLAPSDSSTKAGAAHLRLVFSLQTTWCLCAVGGNGALCLTHDSPGHVDSTISWHDHDIGSTDTIRSCLTMIVTPTSSGPSTSSVRDQGPAESCRGESKSGPQIGGRKNFGEIQADLGTSGLTHRHHLTHGNIARRCTRCQFKSRDPASPPYDICLHACRTCIGAATPLVVRGNAA